MRALFASIVFVASFAAAGSAADAQVAVVANRSVPAQAMDNRSLLDLFSGDVKTWSSGERVVLVDLKPRGTIKDQFYEFLGVSASRLKSIWMKNMLAGEGDPPVSISSEDELIKKIAQTPGAIGYVSIDKARAAGSDVITLLEIPVKE